MIKAVVVFFTLIVITLYGQQAVDGVVQIPFKPVNRIPKKPFTVINKLEPLGIKVLTGQSPDFDTYLAKLLNPEAIKKAAPVLDKAIILINTGTTPIWGFTIIYKYPEKLSLSGAPWEHRIRRFASNADSTSMFQPGDSFFFTPVADFEARLGMAGALHREPSLDEGLDQMMDAYFDGWANERSQVSVDAVIFPDGTIHGDDAADTYGWIKGQMQAEDQLQTAFDALTGEPLKNKLLAMVSARGSTHYEQTLANTAAMIVREINARGEPKVRAEMANRKANLPFKTVGTFLRRVQ